MVDKIGKILVVCANADYPNNLSDTKDLVHALLEEKLLPDKPYELISVNPAPITRKVVYDSFIQGYFGSEEFLEKYEGQQFDAIFFQGCMSGGSFDIGSISIFYPKNTIPTIKHLLKKGGLFLNRENSYNRGDGQSIRTVVMDVLDFVQTISYNSSRFLPQKVSLDWDVWTTR